MPLAHLSLQAANFHHNAIIDALRFHELEQHMDFVCAIACMPHRVPKNRNHLFPILFYTLMKDNITRMSHITVNVL